MLMPGRKEFLLTFGVLLLIAVVFGVLHGVATNNDVEQIVKKYPSKSPDIVKECSRKLSECLSGCDLQADKPVHAIVCKDKNGCESKYKECVQ